ncbi:hypothetical protein [Salegentibacter sediminis]|uniref:hypothetical protein n=1 Tax=Salegentibacter sediminis TaxID=1930251 RepID=UPI0009BD0432|nr:hypothetical protein [Salegentibacter sediminis]
MERSIENIWKKGFKAEEKLSLPVISNLYKRKSGLIIDQISNTSKKDNLSLLPMAVVIFGVFAFIGKVMLGIYLAVFIIALFFLNKKMLNDLKDLDIKDNTYNYLLRYRNQVKRIIIYTTWLIGLGLPLVTLPAYWMFFRGTKVFAKFKELDFTMEMLLIIGMAVFLSILGILSYRLVTKIVYGRLLARLESIIEDMEDLMKA